MRNKRSGKKVNKPETKVTEAPVVKVVTVKPKTRSQAYYINLLERFTVTFGLGPAGTGKTFLAVAQAIKLLQEKKVDRVILCRPAVEAGEKIGFLPGGMKEKIDPYLRPLYDAINELMPTANVDKLIIDGKIEIAVLGFIRGRTFKNAYVILDEAQNTTITQIKMFLTRMGEGSFLAVNGDLSQIDLPKHVPSGLRYAVDKLEAIDEIAVFEFEKRDIIRHELVTKMVNAFGDE